MKKISKNKQQLVDAAPTADVVIKQGLRFIAKGVAKREYQIESVRRDTVMLKRLLDDQQMTTTVGRCLAMIAEVK